MKSQKSQKDLHDLVRKLGEYITAMRIELERKKIVAAVSFYFEVIYHSRVRLTS